MELKPATLATEFGDDVAFGPFLLSARHRRLTRGGELVPVGSRALDILCLLVERPGEIVGHDEIRARVWPGLHVDESNLRVHISSLRKALGERSGGERYIANVPNRGYSFVAAVEPAAPSPPAPPPTPVAEPSPAATEPGRAQPLPRRLWPVIGRDEVLDTIAGDLAEHCLVTVSGPGGIGKSTVAIAAARRLAPAYRDGACFVDLGVLADPFLVVPSINTALGVASGSGDPTAELLGFLRDRHLLLLLDSCEPVIERAAAIIESVLREAPGVTILATSREPLRAEAERVRRLPPMALPPPNAAPGWAEALGYAAIRLFAERAAAAGATLGTGDEDAQLTAQICQRLDGIPLAIELAAARAGQIGLAELASRLDGRFGLLMQGRRTALPRHKTMRATLDWSFTLLSAAEQRLATSLAVFRGSFTLDAAVAVIGRLGQEDAGEADPDAEVADGIAALVEKSLLVADHGEATTFYRFLDVTRAYLHERLVASARFQPASQAHASFYLGLLEQAFAPPADPTMARVRGALGRCMDNIRAALDWAFGPGAAPCIGIDLTLAAYPLWTSINLFDEARWRLQCAIERSAAIADLAPARRARLYAALGTIQLHTAGSIAEIERSWSETLRLAELGGDPFYQLRGLQGLAAIAQRRSLADALALARRYRSRAAALGDEYEQVTSERLLGWLSHLAGWHQVALDHVEHAVARLEEARTFERVVRRNFDEHVLALGTLARIRFLLGQPAAALELANQAVRAARRLGHIPSLVFAFAFIACPIALLQGDLDLLEDGRAILRDEMRQHSTFHGWVQAYDVIDRAQRGEPGLAEMLEAAIALTPATSFGRQFPLLHATLAELHLAEAAPARALMMLDAILAAARARGEHWYEPEFLRIRARALDALGRREEAGAALAASLSLAQAQGARGWELRGAVLRVRRSPPEERPAVLDALARLRRAFGRADDGADLRAADALLARPPG